MEGRFPSCGADAVIATAELEGRPSRAPDYRAESRAFADLARSMSGDRTAMLQHLVETVMELTRCDSAGVSLLEANGDQGVFRWVATAGAWAPYQNGTMPREESPCGEVIARKAVLLVQEPARAFPALLQAEPGIGEGLLAPFDVNGAPGGTVWAIMHNPTRHFEAEDARLLESLARFASLAHQVMMSHGVAKEEIRLLQNELVHRSRDSAMGSMAATVAHEVNQPLLAAAMFAGGLRTLIKAGAAPKDLIDGVDGVDKAVQRAGDIVRRLRDLAKGGLPKFTTVRSRDLVRDTIKYLGEVCSGTKLQLDLNDEAFVHCDAVQIEQVLMNLIRNACEAARAQPQPTVTVRTFSDNREHHFEIEDNGPGLSPEQKESLFDTGYTTKPKGMGIGLPISRTILEGHGRALQTNNLQPHGARFSFSLAEAERSEIPATSAAG